MKKLLALAVGILTPFLASAINVTNFTAISVGSNHLYMMLWDNSGSATNALRIPISLLFSNQTASGLWDFDLVTGNSLYFGIGQFDQLYASNSVRFFSNTVFQGEVTTEGALNLAQGVTEPDIAIEDFNRYDAGTVTNWNRGENWTEAGVVTGDAEVASVTLRGGRTRNVLRMTRGDYVRKMPWGTNWTAVNIGLLWRVNHDADFTNRTALGVSVATNNPFGSGSCDNWVGIYNSGFDFAWSNQMDVAFFDVKNIGRFAKKVAGTLSDLGSGSGSPGRAVAAQDHLSLWIVNLSRGDAARPVETTSMSWRHKMPTLTPAASGINRRPNISTLLHDLEGESAGGFAVTAGNSATASIDAGAHDCVNFYWDHPTIEVEIAAIIIQNLY